MFVAPAFELLKALLGVAGGGGGGTAAASSASPPANEPGQDAAAAAAGKSPGSTARRPGVLEWAERALVIAMVASGLASLGILAAMALSDDCGCSACP